MHKKDWSNITGLILVKKYGKVITVYKDIYDFCSHVNYYFIDRLTKPIYTNQYIKNYFSGNEYYTNLYIKKYNWDLPSYTVTDQDNLQIPVSILKRIYCEYTPKQENIGYRVGSHYKFRDGPIERGIYHSGKKFNGGGWTRKKYKHIAKRRADEAMFYDEDCMFYGIKPRYKAMLPDAYDNEAPTRQGQSWKRYRKTQYKPK